MTFLEEVRRKVEKEEKACATCGNLVRIGGTLIGCVAHDKLILPKTDPSELSALLRTKAVSGLEALILEWPRRSARASRRRSSIPYLKAATSSSAPSAVPTLHGPKLESRASVQSADNP